ncbi:MAG: methylglyoxal synthase [Clostridia bacterium]|nr:methylglyoxal synthase [Clostridia bacterium]
MEIAIIADDTKKELITQFCIAYCGTLSKHSICATSTTGAYISEATGLKIEKLLSGTQGGEQQIASRVSFDEIDVLFYFRATTPRPDATGVNLAEQNLLRLCDVHNVPVATNIATAEVIVNALERGELDYREFINPCSEYNLRHKGKPNY